MRGARLVRRRHGQGGAVCGKVKDMDFGWALRAMKNGEKVRRKRWAPESRPHGAEPTLYRHVQLEHREGYVPDLVHERHNGQRGHFHLLADHLLAEDWELA